MNVPDSHNQSPGQVFARRVKEARKRRGWTQQDLSEAVERAGGRLDRTTIAKIERGGERADKAARANNVPLHEVFVLAAALDVAPVHLLVPLEDEAAVAITPKHVRPAARARAWIRGRESLSDDARAKLTFYSELPENELREVLAEVAGGDPAMDEAQKMLMAIFKQTPPGSMDKLADALMAAEKKKEEDRG